MVLTGAMFSFDKINRHLGGGGEKVPIIADFMPSRWAFEALLVNQFMNNEYEKKFYDIEKKCSNYDFKNVYLIPELKKTPESYIFHMKTEKKNPLKTGDLLLLRNEIENELEINKKIKFNYLDKLTLEQFNIEIADSTISYLSQLQEYYKTRFNSAFDKKEQIIASLQDTLSGKNKIKYQELMDRYHNNYLMDFATNRFAPLPLVRINNHYIQKKDPIYLDPKYSGFLNYRAHFLAPRKYLFGILMDTFWVNIIVIWFFTIMLYLLLYYDGLKKFLNFPEKMNILFSKIFPEKKLKTSLPELKKPNTSK